MSLPTTPQGQVLKDIMTARGGSRPIIDSWNFVVRHRFQKIMWEKYITIDNMHVAKFSNPQFVRPLIPDLKTGKKRALLPAETRRTGQTYEADMFGTLQIYTFALAQDNTWQLMPIPGQCKDVFLGRIPVMILSELDWNAPLSERERYMAGEGEKDSGGYFIIGGMEKYMNSPEHLRMSYPFMYEDKTGVVVRYTSQTVWDPTTVNIILENKNIIETTFTKIGISKYSVNIFYIFYILGFTQNTIGEAIMTMNMFITGPKAEIRKRRLREYLEPTIGAFDSQTAGGSDERVYAMLSDVFSPSVQQAPNRDAQINQFIRSDYLKNITYIKNSPNLDQNEALRQKIRTFAQMIVKYVDHKNGYRGIDDRDSWGNKKIDTPGLNFENKFLEIWKSIMEKLQTTTTQRKWKTVDELKNGIPHNLMGKEFRDAFTKGTWGRKDVPIVDSLKRDTHHAVIAQIRRVTTPTNRRAKIREKRMVHVSQWNVMCPEASPEGEACGLVKDPAISIYISQDRDPSPILSRLNGRYNVTPTNDTDGSLFVNGIHLGFGNLKLLHQYLIDLRRTRQQVYFDTAIVLNEYNELYVMTTAGRLVIPYFVVDHDTQDLIITQKNLWNADIEVLLDEGAIEYVDSSEQEQINILVARTIEDLADFRQDRIDTKDNVRQLQEAAAVGQVDEKTLSDALASADNIESLMRYTHSIIDPSSILGVSASTMPYPQNNPSARVVYQASMSRQALGLNSSRIELRFDTNIRTLTMPDVPVVATDVHEQLGLDRYPAGVTAIVAFMTRGQNQDDAISINAGSVKRGMFNMNIHHSYKAIIKQSKDFLRVVGVPVHSPSQAARYSKLDPHTGIVRVGQYVGPDDCLVGITTIANDTKEARNSSIFVEINKEGIVEEVFETKNAEVLSMILIRIRESKDPEIGDKFASRYSQKGVAGEFVPEDEMPYVISNNPAMNGVRPDVIFNPHGMPTRMTIGKQFEMMTTKVALMTGKRVNASAFRKMDVRKTKDALASVGFSRSGMERMVDGKTGRVLDAEIFVGAVYYQVLRHLVKYKMQARGTGPVQFLTRQPVSGIRRVGGLRFGEMERDQVIASGGQALLQERFMISSDVSRPVICATCGLFAINDIYHQEFKCQICKHEVQPRRVTVPYPFQLLGRYLAACQFKLTAKVTEPL